MRRNSIPKRRSGVRHQPLKSTSLRALTVAALLERTHDPDDAPGSRAEGQDGHERPAEAT